jgi:Predicted nucleotide-binding protein containing TIR-like domain
MVDSTSPQESIILSVLLSHLERAKSILAKGSVKRGHVHMWSSLVKSQIQKIYGADHVISESLSPKLIPEGVDFGDELRKRMALLENYVKSLERSGSKIFLGKNEGSKIFIGHGRSPMWRELKDFLNDRLSLPWEEFNREPVAGIPTFERIAEMLDSASFALLIMTAEDQHSDSSTHARQNVVHEVGLFQGRLGPRKAIILMEDGCSEFSNIIGLSQIRFPKGKISAGFEEIRRVLEREGVMKT